MLDLKPKSRPAPSPPAKTWRNYYRIYRVLNLDRLGTVFPGVHAGPDTFPSQEIAESHGLHLVAALNWPGRCIVEFAGAFPEGERAN
ncbi:MAG: hypothetical protein DCF16_09085 [Alphaproteobacteria bacterium]|jgi:hypothetical protein|nr:MAG: hypothetical protein DCF16_09085 [Alphaproteobacteria bacterium]